MNHRMLSTAVAFSLAMILTAIQAHAQRSGAGAISGLVKDTTGAVVPDAGVDLMEVSTGIKRGTHSNSAGAYSFGDLPEGTYTITVAHPSFRTEVESDIRLAQGITLTLDVQLTIGSVNEKVEVRGATPVVDTVSNETATTMLTEEVTQLPIAMSGGPRAAQNLLNVMSGVNNPGAGGNVAMSNIDGVPNGHASSDVEGLPASSSTHEVSDDQSSPVPEAVAEFQLKSNDDAQYGWNEGAGMSLVLKSGTNQLHGTLYEYLRNTILDAKNYFATTASDEKQNEYGFVVGGPVLIPKVYNGLNRTFFFVDFERFSLRQAAPGAVTTVPTALEKQGNFTELLGPQIGTDQLGRPIYTGEMYDPLTTRPDGKGGFLRDPFMFGGQLNVIDPARLSSFSTSYEAFYPAPNLPGLSLNWQGLNAPSPQDFHRILVKIDQNIGQKQRLSGGYKNLYTNIFSGGPFGAPIAPDVTIVGTDYFSWGSYSLTATPQFLWSIRADISRSPREVYSPAAQRSLSGPPDVPSPGVPLINIQGYPVRLGAPYELANDDVGQTNSIFNDFSWTKGTHSIKFGGQLFQTIKRVSPGGATAGQYTFQNVETGLPGYTATGAGYASFLLGEVDSAGVAVPEINEPHYFGGAVGLYAQDQWRPSSALTLNFGLRWDLYVPTREATNQIGALDPYKPNPAAGGILGATTIWGKNAGENGRVYLYNFYYKAFGPKLGIAYAPNPRTVIRAHYGISYSPLFGDFTSGAGAPTVGFNQSAGISSLDNGVTPAFNWNNGFPNVYPKVPNLDPSLQNGQGISYVNVNNNRPAMAQNVNFGISRELPYEIGLRVDYIGNFTRRLATNGHVQLNQLNPKYLSLGGLLLDDITSPQAIAAGIATPYPGFTGSVAQALLPFPQFQGGIPYLGASVGYLEYNSLQVNLQKRLSHGLTFLVAYTVSKSLGNVTYSNQGWSDDIGLQNTSQLKGFKELYPQDIPQNLAVSYVYHLPIGPGERFLNSDGAWSRELLGGWSVAGIQNYQAGTPFNVGSEETIPGNFEGVWPNLVPGVPVRTSTSCGGYTPGTSTYLNLGAFSTPAPFTLGDVHQLSSVRTCKYMNESISVQKQFKIVESAKVTIGSDFFNAFNRHQWTGLSTDINNPGSFGRFTGASQPRNIQVFMKFDF